MNTVSNELDTVCGGFKSRRTAGKTRIIRKNKNHRDITLIILSLILSLLLLFFFLLFNESLANRLCGEKYRKEFSVFDQ